MKYDQLIIYYFSGTGNAKNAALWIIDTARNKGLKTQLINIDRFETVKLPNITAKTLMGFCAPTHGFNLPPIMLKFIAKFPRINKVDSFILNTRGGLKLHKLFLPGLSGAAQILPAFMLWLKGFRVVGMQALDLPSNWLLLHPGVKEKVVRSIYKRCKPIVNKFTISLLEGKRKYKALLSLPFDIAILPITLLYYLIGRFFLAKTLVASHACNHCNLCVAKCPVEAIVTIKKRPFWTYRCESCMRCVNICPQRAIETAHSFITIMMLSSSLILSPMVLKGLKTLGAFQFFEQSFLTQKLVSLINSLFLLAFTIICYSILHFLMRNKYISRIVTYTSLSSYKFWRRYKVPKNLAAGNG